MKSSILSEALSDSVEYRQNDETPQLRTIFGTLASIRPDGYLIVSIETEVDLVCECLHGPFFDPSNLYPGCRVVFQRFENQPFPVVIGLVGPLVAHIPPSRITIEATESLTLKCGDASVELRADGKAMVKGDDVLIRAKGTQRIRAGTVSIN